MARAASPIFWPNRPARREVRLATSAGKLTCVARGAAVLHGGHGPPRLGWRDIPLAHAVPDTGAVDLGAFRRCRPPPASAWAIRMRFFSSTISTPSIFPSSARRSNMIRCFPQRANISLAQVLVAGSCPSESLGARRGPDAACGTAACATLVAGGAPGCSAGRAKSSLPGGDLSSHWRESRRSCRNDRAGRTGIQPILDAAIFAPRPRRP